MLRHPCKDGLIYLVFLLFFTSLCAAEQFKSPIKDKPEQTWQLSQELVMRGAEVMYRKRIDDLAHGFQLDTDPVFLARVQAVMLILQRQAQQDFPDSRNWSWEVHVTKDSADSADSAETSYCMAGGKILISQPQLERLSLNDVELAMMMAHEMQHALQQHHLLEYQETLRLFPMRAEQSFDALQVAVDDDDQLLRALSPLNLQQELQADVEGMQLAWRAGFPVEGLLKFYKKLAQSSAYANFDSKTHPAPNQRLMAAQALAQKLVKNALKNE